MIEYLIRPAASELLFSLENSLDINRWHSQGYQLSFLPLQRLCALGELCQIRPIPQELKRRPQQAVIAVGMMQMEFHPIRK